MILKANEKDKQFIIKHSTKSFSEGTGNSFPIPEEKANHLLNSILDRGGYHLVFKESDEVKGWILLGSNKDYFTDETHGFIYDVYVFQEYRGNGISKNLMEAGIDELKAAGYSTVRLNVYSSNHAKKIYEKMGFTDLHTIMEYKLA